MKNKEKANEIGRTYARQYHHNTFEGSLKNSEFVFSDEECTKSALEMAKWMIEKACEWLNNNTITSAIGPVVYTASSYDINKEEFIESFKKAMEE